VEQKNNHAHIQDSVSFSENMDTIDQWILCDAVTSGGLLISVAGDNAENLLSELLDAGVEAAIIGEVIEDHTGKIVVI